jgi:sporulation-control protein spo0M
MIGRGKIDITLEKPNYIRGGTISGTVTLTLGKPVKARGMSISLIGEGKTRVTTPSTGRAQIQTYATTVTCTTRFYNSEQQLDGEKEYSEGQEHYFFETKIPANVLDVRPRIIGGIKWYLVAKLDIPHGLDVTKKLRMTIR